MIATTGQPVVLTPSKGVQPQREAIQEFPIAARLLQIDDREIRLKPHGDAALAGHSEEPRRPRARQIDETQQR